MSSNLSSSSGSSSFRHGSFEHFTDPIPSFSRAARLVSTPMHDRWRWSLSGDGEFSVASVRNLIDDRSLAEVGAKTRWIKYVPIKVNILAWRIKLNNLPSRLNLSRRGLDLDTIFCPSCNSAVESSNHIFFGFPMVKDLYKFLARWWDVSMTTFFSCDEWWNWGTAPCAPLSPPMARMVMVVWDGGDVERLDVRVYE
nr:RNA-directed DNA polymerase, eukaryota [Tanacetum cinerariifolium]